MPYADWTGKSTLLRFDRVGKAFGARRVLHDLTMEVAAGEVVTVTGANGAGKSTLLRIAAGLLRATRGTTTLTVGGETRTEGGLRRFWVGYASPELALYPELTGRENLDFFARLRGEAAASDADLHAVGLSGRGGDWVGSYSSGMRQRLRLAFARGAQAPLLLLDEPSLALDAEGVALVAQMVDEQRHRGGITLIATNDPRETALGDRNVALLR